MYDVFEISKYFILRGLGTQFPVSNMKLQKLLYYSQGWYLASHSEPLFANDFYKWDFGPVCPDVYYYFKPFKGNPIPDTYSNSVLPERIRNFLDKIWQTYGDYSALQLSALSHREAPWRNTPDSMLISKSVIQEFYMQKLLGAQSGA